VTFAYRVTPRLLVFQHLYCTFGLLVKSIFKKVKAFRNGTWKFDRGLGQILHDELHWLDVPDRVFFKLAVTVHRCLNDRAPPYLSDDCVPAAGVDIRQHLRSANRQLLAVTSLPAQHLRPSGLFSCRAHSLEFSPGFHPRPDHQCRRFQTFA